MDTVRIPPFVVEVRHLVSKNKNFIKMEVYKSSNRSHTKIVYRLIDLSIHPPIYFGAGEPRALYAC
jgi:hypothetical protein